MVGGLGYQIVSFWSRGRGLGLGQRRFQEGCAQSKRALLYGNKVYEGFHSLNPKP